MLWVNSNSRRHRMMRMTAIRHNTYMYMCTVITITAWKMDLAPCLLLLSVTCSMLDGVWWSVL